MANRKQNPLVTFGLIAVIAVAIFLVACTVRLPQRPPLAMADILHRRADFTESYIPRAFSRSF